jgi:hypothetical protein
MLVEYSLPLKGNQHQKESEEKGWFRCNLVREAPHTQNAVLDSLSRYVYLKHQILWPSSITVPFPAKKIMANHLTCVSGLGWQDILCPLGRHIDVDGFLPKSTSLKRLILLLGLCKHYLAPHAPFSSSLETKEVCTSRTGRCSYRL